MTTAAIPPEIPPDFPYKDILSRERPPSRHPPMSMEGRAAQFASFDALEGFKHILRKTGAQHRPEDDSHWEKNQDEFL